MPPTPASDTRATDVDSDMTVSRQQYTSGDPRLAAMDEEVEEAPRFDDPYKERQYLKHRLAIAFRIFARLGLAEGIAGHLTLRDPVDPTSFWVNPFGLFTYTLFHPPYLRISTAQELGV